jgi:hypothetical protein
MKKVVLLFAIILCGFIAKSQTVTDTVRISLAGSTDSDGSIASYSFTQTSGTTVTIIGAATATPTIVFASSGNYLFSGSVTDNDGAVSSATLAITVNAANVPPHVRITINGVDYTNSTYPIKLK